MDKGFEVVVTPEEADCFLIGSVRRIIWFTDVHLELVDSKDNVIFSTKGNSWSSGGMMINPQDDYDDAFRRACKAIPECYSLFLWSGHWPNR